MRKNLTVYCIHCSQHPKAFLAIADNSIPLTFINSYVDIDNSVIFERYISLHILSELKKICQDTGKTAILNCNNKDSTIQEITREIIGHTITWKDYDLKEWQDFIIGGGEYTLLNKASLEIDHPVDLKDSKLKRIIKEGLKSLDDREKESRKLLLTKSKKAFLK